jgi:hypothetical protein
MKTTLRRLAAVAMVPLVAAVTLVALPGQANAAVGDFTCTVSNVVSFSPGLTLTSATQQVTLSVGYSNCLSTSHPAVTSGTRSASFSRVLSCLTAPSGGTQIATVTWNTGQTSTFSGTVAFALVAGQLIFTWQGTVTAGLFTGSAFTEVIAQVALNLLACVIPPGVTSQSGTGVLTSI